MNAMRPKRKAPKYRHFRGDALMASNAGVPTPAIFARPWAPQKRLLGSLPKPGFGTKCPKVLSASQALTSMFLILPSFGDMEQMIHVAQ